MISVGNRVAAYDAGARYTGVVEGFITTNPKLVRLRINETTTLVVHLKQIKKLKVKDSLWFYLDDISQALKHRRVLTVRCYAGGPPDLASQGEWVRMREV